MTEGSINGLDRRTLVDMFPTDVPMYETPVPEDTSETDETEFVHGDVDV